MERVLAMPNPLPETLPPGTRLLPPNEHLMLEMWGRLVRQPDYVSYQGPWGGAVTGAHPNNIDWASVPSMREVTEGELHGRR